MSGERTLSRRFTAFVTRRPRRLIATVLLIGAAALAVGLPVVHILVPTRTDFDDAHAQAGQVEHELRHAAGTEIPGGLIVLVHSHRDVLRTPGERRRLTQIASIVRRDRAVASVRSPIGPGGAALVAKGRRAAYVVATLRALPPKDVQDAVRRVRAGLTRQPETTLGGIDVAFEEVGKQTEHDLVSAELIAFPILLLLALFIFRGVVAAVLPLLVGALSIALTLGAMRGVNEIHGLSNFGLNLVTALSLGLGIDYSLFIVSRFREELGKGAPPPEAVARTMATAGRTIAISAITIAAALASLLIFPQPFLSSMGICGSLVALSAAAVALTVLPAALFVLGPRIDALSLARWRRANRREARGEQRGFWYRLASTVQRRPVPVAVLASAFLLAVAAPSLNVQFVPFGATMLPTSASARQVDTALRQDFQAQGSPIVVVADPPHGGREIAPLRQRLARVPGVAAADPPRPLRDGKFELLLSGRHPDDSPAARATVRHVRAAGGQVPIQVGGVTAAAIDKVDSLGAHLPLALALLATTTFALIFLLTRSILLPAKALLINLLTVASVFGVLVLIFQEGYLHRLLGFSPNGGLEATQPVLLVAVAFGLSTDYGIFLLARVTEAHAAGKEARDAASTGLQQTGRIVTAAAALFCIATGALASSPLTFVKLLGIGIPLAVLLDATISRALLVPSLIALLGRWNWYAPRALQRVHDSLPVGSAGGVEDGGDDRDGGFDRDGRGDGARRRFTRGTDSKREEYAMRRLALFTAECAQLGPALTEIIERHHDQLAVVVTSRVAGGKRPSLARQTVTNFKRAGSRFVAYLVCSFVLYHAFIAADRARSLLLRRPRRRLSVAELCERHGIRHIETDDVNSEAVASSLAEARIDHIVIYWFDQIIQDNIIRCAARSVINVHAAFLPNCRGLFPVFWSAARCGVFGITAHEIENTEIDAGPILRQVEVEVESSGQRSVFYWDYCVNRAGVELLDAVLGDLDGDHDRRWQPPEGSYYSYPTRSDVKAARARGIELIRLRDFLDVCKVHSNTAPARSRWTPHPASAGSRSGAATTSVMAGAPR